MHPLTLPIASINIGDRQRQDYGDIEDLADSLDHYGLIQPVVLDDQNNLIAGGRRIAAAKSLGWTDIKVVYFGTLTDDEREELELEENVRRKDMLWTERVVAISRIHAKKQYLGALDNKEWGYRETGELLGMTKSNVHYALWAATRIKDKDPQVLACANMSEVIRLILQRKEDETLQALASEAVYVPDTTSSLTTTEEDGGITQAIVSIKLNVHHTDALLLMRRLGPSVVDHIITDPPYGISMDNLQQDNLGQDVSRTAEEHGVRDNLTLLQHFLPLAFDNVKSSGFCVLWCDQDNWTTLRVWAEDVGWRVQRWPLIWIKTDPCQNGAAQYNFTKRHEIAMVLRKPGATLNQVQPQNYYIGTGEDKRLFSHPFAKPRDLHKWVINAVSQPGQTIFDPFAGSGTCPVACIETGRQPICCELVEIHHNECLENIKRAYRATHGPEVKFV